MKIFNLFSKYSYSNIFFIFFTTLYFVYRFSIIFSYEPELTNGESNNIWNAINVSHGKEMYSNPEALPLEVYQYTPLAQLPVIGFASVFNDKSPSYIYNITVSGRLMEFVFNLISFSFLFFICFRFLLMSKQYSYLTSLLSLVLLTPTAFTIRPDALSLVFILSTIYLFLDYNSGNKSIVRLLFISCWISISFFVKQDTVFLIFPIGLYFLVLKKWKNLFVFTCSFTLSLIILLLFTDFYFGNFFIYSITKGIQNNPSINQVFSVFDRSFGFFPLHFVLGNSLLFFLLFKNFHIRHSSFYIVLIFCALYEMLAIVATSKLGSWCNYYTPFVILSTTIIICFFYENKLQVNKSIFSTRILFISCGVIMGVFLFKQVYFYTSTFLHYSTYKKQYYSEYYRSNELKEKLQITTKSNVLLLNRISKNFLATNTIMVNTEYYPISNFNYSKFYFEKNKPIDYIIFEPTDKTVILYLISKFNLRINNYKEIDPIGKYTIWKKLI